MFSAQKSRNRLKHCAEGIPYGILWIESWNSGFSGEREQSRYGITRMRFCWPLILIFFISSPNILTTIKYTYVYLNIFFLFKWSTCSFKNILSRVFSFNTLNVSMFNKKIHFLINLVYIQQSNLWKKKIIGKKGKLTEREKKYERIYRYIIIIYPFTELV